MTEIPLPVSKFRTEAVRKVIGELLDQCTDKQRAHLHQIHNSAPWHGLKNCPENKLDETYELLRRTVMKNIFTEPKP